MFRRASLLAVIGLLFATANVAASTEHDVSMIGSGHYSFSPTATTAQFGDTVKWTNATTVAHTTTSDITGLWDSGHLAPNATFVHTFDDAGTFAFHCMIHGYMHGTVTVALQTSATSGARGTTFTITVSDASAPAGWTHEVQKMKVGGAWKAWQSTTGQSLSFKPKKKGTYEFRARLHKTTGSTATGWSPILSIKVS